ncbi:MAG: DUF748 domain-containing protein [Planctomycetes bacterium]|nr:DUF748 domain-containing protein [Planctomycetota bacterium]
MTAPRPRRRWRRRLLWAFAAVVATRLLLALLLPWLLGMAARAGGLELDYRAAQLSLSGLSLRLDDVVLRDPAGGDGPPLFAAQEVFVDAATWQLLRGRLVVVDVALSGARVHVAQGADGRLRLPAAWQAQDRTAEPVAVPAEAAAPLRFDAPLQVASLRVHDLRLTLAQTDTATQTEFTFDADVADLGRSDRPGSITARLHSPGRIDAVDLQATLALAGDTAAATWQVTVRGLRPTALPWLDDPAAAPVRHVVGLDLAGELEARVGDQGAPPTVAAELHLRSRVDEQEQLSVDVTAGPSRTNPDAWELPIGVSASGKDLVDELQLADARLVVARDRTRLDGALRLEGATLRRLAPWLASVGITMPAAGLSLRAGLRSSLQPDQLSAEVVDLSVGDGDRRLELPSLAVRDVRAAGGVLQIGAIEVEGPRVGVTVTATGELETLGMRLSPRPQAAATAGAPAAASSAPFTWPRIQVQSFDWRGIDVHLVDLSLAAPAELALGLELHGERLAVGLDAPPGRLTARARVPGSIDELRAEFDLTPAAEAIAAEGRCTATGVTARSLAPWLQRAGLTPNLENGAGRAQVSVQVRGEPPTIGLQAHIADVRFEDGDEVLLGLRRIDGKDVVLAPALDLGTWTVDEPYVVVHRRAAGSLAALGFDLGPATPPAATAAPATTAAAPEPATTPSPQVRHGRFELRRAVLRWIDASRPTPADVSLGLDLRVEPRAAAAGLTTEFVAALRLEPGIGTLDATGTLQRADGGGRIDVELAADHLRGAGLQALLPPEIACTLEDGTLRSTLAAQWQQAAALGLRVSLHGTALRDRGAELFALDALDIDLPAVSAERVHLATAQVQGLRAVAASTADGLHLPGFQFRPTRARSAPPPVPVEATAAVAAAPLQLPALRVDAVDLAIERLIWRRRGDTDGEPLVVSARLSLAEPWATAVDPAATPECRLRLQAAATPLCREVTVTARLAPFALAPTADLDVRATGIDTTALTRVLPELAGSLTGTCADSAFATSVHAHLDLRRRDPLRFDFGSPFGGELLFAALDLRDAGSDTPLLHIDEVAVDLRAFDPRTGDVLLRSVEVDGPRLHVENSPAGLACFGVRLAPPPTADPPAPAPPTSPAAPAAPATAEVAVDRLQIQGLDLTFTDPATEPPTVLPLRDSDLKVLNLSTRALVEARPIAFSATLRGGDLSLDRRVQRSSVLAGLLGSAAEALTGNADRFAPEQRPLVDEISVAGQLQPFPQPKGQVRAVVNSLELPALRGLAKAGGVDIADGVFDFTLDARLQGAQGVDLRLRPKFTWLSLSEPPGGPISTYLKLPAPLDTVLFALRNDADEHVLPLQLQLPAEGLSGGAVAEAAAEALVRLIADAVASAAFRVGGMVTGAVGLGGATDLRSLVATLEFPAGDPLPAGGSLEPLLAAAADDPELVIVLAHELGHGDLERAAQLASPPPDIVAATVARLRAARAVLERERAELAGRTAALFGAGRVQEAWQQHTLLRQTDDRLGALVRTQEEALRMSMGENERAVRRRTRAAATAMAEARLQSVQQQIAQRFGAAMAQRVEWRPPRGLETAGLPAGGRVVATVRRRAAR